MVIRDKVRVALLTEDESRLIGMLSPEERKALLLHAAKEKAQKPIRQTQDEVILTALLTEDGYKGYRLKFDEFEQMWTPEHKSRTYGWESCSTRGYVTGNIRVYKSQKRAYNWICSQISNTKD